MPTITPFLWFDNNAEEAMNLYCSIFPDSRAIGLQKAQGRVMGAEFELQGQRFKALNGGPMFKFNEAISMFVSCKTQEEIDTYWDKLIADGGAPSRCGWLKDKFGLSWQIIPEALPQLLSGPSADAAQRTVAAMMTMQKLDIAALKSANAGS